MALRTPQTGKYVQIRVSVDTYNMMEIYLKTLKVGGTKCKLADKAIQDFIRYETQIKKKF